MRRFSDIVLAQGMSDEFSFILHPDTTLFKRRASKISSAIVSLFTSSFVHHWSEYFPSSPLTGENLPFFDSRVVCYPRDEIVKDYLRWRQVDCHINNLYNTCFWKLVERISKEATASAASSSSSSPPLSEKECRDRAHAEMQTLYPSSAQKNELLFSQFGLNYNEEPEVYRKGSVIVWREGDEEKENELNYHYTRGKGDAPSTVNLSVSSSLPSSSSSSSAASSSCSTSCSSSPSTSLPPPLATDSEAPQSTYHDTTYMIDSSTIQHGQNSGRKKR